MILVSVQVPALERSWDVRIDEDQPVGVITAEIASLICRENQCSMHGDKQQLLLWDRRNGRILRREMSAWDEGLRNGSELILA